MCARPAAFHFACVAGSQVPTSSTWHTFMVFVSTPPRRLTSALEEVSMSKCWNHFSFLAPRSGTAVRFGAEEPPPYPGRVEPSVVCRTTTSTCIGSPPKSSWYQFARLAAGYRWGPVLVLITDS